jgi:hypothetical protein
MAVSSFWVTRSTIKEQQENAAKLREENIAAWQIGWLA